MVVVVLGRLIRMVVVMFGISVITFLIFFATPGSDPASRIAGRNASPETVEAVLRGFGLDRPLYVQYGLMMKRLFVTRDLTSFANRGQQIVPAVRASTRAIRTHRARGTDDQILLVEIASRIPFEREQPARGQPHRVAAAANHAL